METKIYVYFILCLLYATNAQDIEPPDLSEFPRPTTKITLMTTEGPNGPKFDKILNMVSEFTTESPETTIIETETTTATLVIITTTTMPETTTTSTSTTTPTTSTTEPPISTTTMPEKTTPESTSTTTTTTTSTTEQPISTTTTTTFTPETPISTTTTTTTTTTPEPPINTQSTSTTTTPSPWIPITTKKIKLPPCWNCYYKEMLGYPHLEFTSTGLKYVHSLNCYRCCYYIGSEFAGCTQISHLICEDYYARAKKLNE